MQHTLPMPDSTYYCVSSASYIYAYVMALYLIPRPLHLSAHMLCPLPYSTYYVGRHGEELQGGGQRDSVHGDIPGGRLPRLRGPLAQDHQGTPRQQVSHAALRGVKY
jgi:hypothetical protein